jgi:hypothetical protein
MTCESLAHNLLLLNNDNAFVILTLFSKGNQPFTNFSYSVPRSFLLLSLCLFWHPFCNQEQEEPERLREETRNRKQQQNKSFRDTIQGSTRRDTYYNLSQANTIAELLFGIHTLIPPPD